MHDQMTSYPTHPLRIVRTVLGLGLAIASLFFVCGCAPSMPQQISDLDSVIQDIERKAYLVRQFNCVFTKTRKDWVFQRELKVRGNLIFQKPAKFGLSLSGDVNVEILSDGASVNMIHDGKDVETFHIRGERDLARFEDPLMTLINSLGNGGLRTFRLINQVQEGDDFLVEAAPNGDRRFERMKTVRIWLSPNGSLAKIHIIFTNGDEDTTVFQTWTALADDDPDLRRLDARLKSLNQAHQADTQDLARGEVRRLVGR
jgi:hypothetical protein